MRSTGLVLLSALALVACGPREPSERDMLNALQRHHQDWAAAQRRQASSEYAPLVNLPFQAALTLNIHTVHKERCRIATEEMGFVCTVTVEASTAFAPHLKRRLEARFVEGTRGWLARAPRPLDAPAMPQAVNCAQSPSCADWAPSRRASISCTSDIRSSGTSFSAYSDVRW